MRIIDTHEKVDTFDIIFYEMISNSINYNLINSFY